MFFKSKFGGVCVVKRVLLLFCVKSEVRGSFL